MLAIPKNDLEYSITRLQRILARRRLTFNPYTVSNKRLVEMVETVNWGNEYDIVQMMTVTFTRMKPASRKGGYEYDGIYMKIGAFDQEILLPLSHLIYPITLTSNARQLRSMVGKRQIRDEKDVVNMVGKKYFVSHTIPGVNIRHEPRVAYYFHRLYRNTDINASIIRDAMMESRLKMLEWITVHSNAPKYLDCRPNFFDYYTPIVTLANQIRNYSSTEIPAD